MTYGHVLVPSCVPLRIFGLLIFRNLLLIIHTSVHFSLFLSFFWFFLFIPNSFVFSPILFLTLKIFPSFPSPHRCIIMTKYVFQSLLSLVYYAKVSRSLWLLIFWGLISKSQFTVDFFQIILCWRIIQTKNMIMKNFTLQILIVLKNLLKK